MIAEVKLWGRTIGAVSLEAGREVAAFQYDPAFATSGIELSPLVMPLSNRVYEFPALARNTFHGLPGLLADSLPDKFGNALIDAAVQLSSGGARAYDEGGAIARAGAVDEALLESLLAHPFFDAEPPKSTGREIFGRPYVAALARDQRVEERDSWPDLVATLTEFTARTIADAIRRWVLPRGADELVVSGGGANNPVLMQRLRTLLAPLPVVDGRTVGFDTDAKEAIAEAGQRLRDAEKPPSTLEEANEEVEETEKRRKELADQDQRLGIHVVK